MSRPLLLLLSLSSLLSSPILLPSGVLAQPAVVVDPATSLGKCDDSSLAVSVTMSGAVDVRGYEVKVVIDETKVALSNTSPYGFAEGPFLDGAGPNAAAFLVFKQAEGSYLVAGTILGGVAGDGADGSGTLFTITGDPIGECTTSVGLSELTVRNMVNTDLGGTVTGGTVNVDCTDPCVTSVTASGTCFTAAPAVTVSGTEGTCPGSDVVALEYQYQPNSDPCNPGGTWLALAAGSFGSGAWGPTGPHTPGTAPAVPGNYTIYVRARDAAGNVTDLCACVAGYNFNYNPTAPTVQVTNLSAARGHNEITLSWTNPVLTGAEVVVIMRKRETVYPTYGTNTTYPTSTSTGVEVFAGTGTGFVDVVGDGTFANRDIYLYRAFVRSCAGELAGSGRAALEDDFVSEATTDATDAATNYYLGDLDQAIPNGAFGGPYDGFVTASDLGLFSGVYGLAPGNAEADFGPTVMPPNSASGVPNPDGLTDFEDLILLAINYGTVAPRQTEEWQDDLALFDDTPSRPVHFSLDPLPGGDAAGKVASYSLVVHGAADRVQGLRAIITFDPTLVTFERAQVTSAVAGAQHPHFFKAVRRAGGVELALAMLGRGATLPAEGAVVTVSLRRLSAGTPELLLSDSTARDIANRELIAPNPEPAAPPVAATAVPAAFRFGDPEPNPFNPATAITFDLAAQRSVRLAIYDAAGRCVRTLSAEVLPAGRYSITWNGTNDRGQGAASGIYFARIEAGEFRAERRLVLLK